MQTKLGVSISDPIIFSDKVLFLLKIANDQKIIESIPQDRKDAVIHCLALNAYYFYQLPKNDDQRIVKMRQMMTRLNNILDPKQPLNYVNHSDNIKKLIQELESRATVDDISEPDNCNDL